MSALSHSFFLPDVSSLPAGKGSDLEKRQQGGEKERGGMGSGDAGNTGETGLERRLPSTSCPAPTVSP